MSVNDMQEWILLLQKLVQDLENSKLLLLGGEALPDSLWLAIGQRPGNAAQHMICFFLYASSVGNKK